jgi:outer membrane lipoprotein-sorting protein
MPKGIWVFAFLGLLGGGGFQAAFGQETEELIRSIDEQQQKIQTLIAHFTQIKETSLVKEPLVSSGLVRFKRPDFIRWTYLKPEPMEVVLDGQTIRVYHGERSQVEEYSLTRNKIVARYLEPLIGVFQHPFTQLTKVYRVTYEGLEVQRTCHFHLQPKAKEIQKFLSGVDLWIDKDSGAILRFKMVEANGDRLILEFHNLQLNPPLNEEDLKGKISLPQRRLGESGS